MPRAPVFDAPPPVAEPAPVPVQRFAPPPAPEPEFPAPPPAAPVHEPIEDFGSDDPIHAPLDTVEVALPSEGRWDEPGIEDEDPTGVLVQTPGEHSWPGVLAFEVDRATFDPKVAELEADQWADEVPPEPEPDHSGSIDLTIEAAESMVARGELGAALGVYQDLALRRPEDARLWQRVEEIARMLQRRSTPPTGMPE